MSEHVLLESLHASAAGETPWDQALERLDRYLGVEGTLLIDTRPTGYIAVHSKSLEASTQTYLRQEWFRLDERYRAVPAMRRGHIANDLDLFSTEAIERMPYYQEFLRPAGLKWWACTIIPMQVSEIAVSFQRTARQGNFQMGDIRKISDVRRHLKEALSIQQLRSRSYVNGIIDLLSTMDQPVFVLSRSGKVTFRNGPAEQLADNCLFVSNDRLQARDPAASQVLEQLLRTATASSPHSGDSPLHVRVSRSTGRAVIVSAIRLNRFVEWTPEAHVLITISDPDQKRVPTAAILADAFGLTRTEAAMAQLVMSGQSLEEASVTLRKTTGTIRQLMKQLFEKSETHRQGEFIAVASRLISAFGHKATDRPEK